MNRKVAAGMALVVAVSAGLTVLDPADAAPPPNAPPPNAQPPAQNVTVVNGVANPVPVTAAQSGPWTVGINGTPAVSIAGTPTVNVGNLPATQTVAGTVATVPGIPAGAFSVGGGTGLTPQDEILHGPVPAGTRYAITSVTVANQSCCDPLIAHITRRDSAGPGQLCAIANPGPPSLEIAVPAADTVQLTFPQPWVFDASASGPVCLAQDSNGPFVVRTMVVGYLIPAPSGAETSRAGQ